jgi:hypothetical protein
MYVCLSGNRVMKRGLPLSIGAVVLVCLTCALGGCSSNSSEPSSAPSTEASPDSGVAQPEATVSSGVATYTVPQDVQDTYFNAICIGPGSKLGMGGTFDEVTKTCTDPSGNQTTQADGLAALLRSTPDEMRSSTQFMVVQVGKPVAGCPTADEYNTVADLTITNSCVENAMMALSVYLTS